MDLDQIQLVLLLAICASSESAFNNFGKSTQEIIEHGKLQYKLLRERENTPQYGACWRNAIQRLEGSCRQLNELTQSVMALRFTDCFLEMSGHAKYECYQIAATDTIEEYRSFVQNREGQKQPGQRQFETKNNEANQPSKYNNCIRSMSDRAFNAYTEFYTQTQNICFFLQNQLWHERTENTIDRLQASSTDVQEKLEQSGQLQQVLMDQQKQSIQVQTQLLKHGHALTTTLTDSQKKLNNILNTFQTQTNKQTEIILLIFEKLHAFQSWVVTEVAWIDTAIFYIITSLTTFVLTANERASRARIVIFIVLFGNIIIESYIPNMVNSFYPNLNMSEAKGKVDEFVWVLRKFIIMISMIIFVYVISTFSDFNKANYQLLLSIKEQNQSILDLSQQILNRYNKQDRKSFDSINDSVNFQLESEFKNSTTNNNLQNIQNDSNHESLNENVWIAQNQKNKMDEIDIKFNDISNIDMKTPCKTIVDDDKLSIHSSRSSAVRENRTRNCSRYNLRRT